MSAPARVIHRSVPRSCSQAARAGRNAELAQTNASFDAKKALLQDKLSHAQRTLQEKESDHKQRQVEEVAPALKTSSACSRTAGAG